MPRKKRQIVTCKWCGKQGVPLYISAIDEKECNRCWYIHKAIEFDPYIAEQIINSRRRASDMDNRNPSTFILLDLYRLHMRAAQNSDEEDRLRLLKMIDDIRWAYPEAAKEVDSLYGGEKE